MKNKLLLTLSLAAALFMGCSGGETLPTLNAKYESATAQTKGDRLTVSTGEIERVWVLTDEGLSTKSIKNLKTGKVWSCDSEACDWSIEGLTDTDAESRAQLLSLTATQSNDEKFTSEHIDVVAELYYPATETTIKYHIWAYPNSPGIRTQLFIKGDNKLATLTERAAEGSTFKSVKGQAKSSYEANGVAGKHFASTLEGEQIEIQAYGIELDKKYKMGVSLWSFDRQGIEQSITITSVDGESRKVVAQGVAVPNYKADKQMPRELIFDLPTEVLLDPSCRVLISGNDKFSTISELYIYEQSEAKYSINAEAERIEELTASAPKGYTLSGYFNCGEKSSGVQIPYNGYVDRLPVDARSLSRSYVGYFNDTQHRNTHDTPLIRESESTESVESEKVNWASVVSAWDSSNDGVIMLKESHKCVNQYGVDTGEFEVSSEGLYNSGLGLNLGEISTDQFKWCWASWSIIYSGDEADKQLAIKRFDRARFPIDPSRDIYIQANTWGSDRSREASRESNILVELDVQKELGVDIQQIDDGWQNNNKDWELRTDWYPEGWSRVRAKAANVGVKLGLWGAAMPIQLEDLKRTYDEGGFVSYKLDFASLGNHKNMDELMAKIRSFVEYTDHKVRVNWDLTENAPRFGYYWAKEYGCVYLENRKPTMPTNVIYVPYLVLRDCWDLAKYTNINKFQTSIQNVDMILKSKSDAHLHSQEYATAIGLSGVPLLFMETHFLSDESVGVMKEIFARYKEHRNEIFESYAFSIGETPDNESWSGFQYVNDKSGHLLLFRELNNEEPTKKIRLEFIKDATLKLTDAMTGEKLSVKVDKEGFAEFEMAKGGEFRLYRYTL
ncbi:MAG: hypothetical protein R3Y16_04520 [Rikenellaceae bacterium]